MSDEEAVELKAPPRMTEEELKNLARCIVTNVTFIAADDRAVESAFMFSLLFDWEGWDLTKIGAFYEDYAKAGPRSVNGYPSFFSLNMVHVDDMQPLRELVQKMSDALA